MRSISKDLLRDGKTTPSHRWVTWWMLYKKREHVIRDIKAPILKAMLLLNTGASWLGMLIALAQIVRVAKRYPEPTKDHTILARTHVLIDVQDEFFENERNAGRIPLFKSLWRMLIIEYEHDPYYAYRINWIIRKLREHGWGDDAFDVGSPCWGKK